MDRNYNIITFILRKPRVVIFSDIIKLVTMFIKAISKEVKRIRNYEPRCNLHLYQKLLISNEKMLMSAKLKWCVS